MRGSIVAVWQVGHKVRGFNMGARLLQAGA
jgi:hypothetical protein